MKAVFRTCCADIYILTPYIVSVKAENIPDFYDFLAIFTESLADNKAL